MIGSSSLKQERAIKFMQFLAGSEGGRLTRWGIEGVHYERRENGSVRFIGDYRYPENYLFDGGTEKRRMAGIDYWLLMENTVANGLHDAWPEAYYTNSDRIALRAMEIRAGQRYKGYAVKDRNPVRSFAELPGGHGLYGPASAWLAAAQEMVTAPSDGAVVQRWEALQQQVLQEGIGQVEAAMTQRYQEALARYQAAGFFLEE